MNFDKLANDRVLEKFSSILSFITIEGLQSILFSIENVVVIHNTTKFGISNLKLKDYTTNV